MIVDARGRGCPEPVVLTKKAVDNYKSGDIEVLLDAQVAVENVTRFAKSKGFNIDKIQEGEEVRLILKKWKITIA